MGYAFLGASPSDCGAGQYFDDATQQCICDYGFVPGPSGGCIPYADPSAQEQDQRVASIVSGGCAGGQQWDDNSQSCVCMQGYLPAPGGGCIHIASSSSFMPGQTAPMTKNPAFVTWSGLTPAPDSNTSTSGSTNSTGLIVAGVLGAGALLLLVAS